MTKLKKNLPRHVAIIMDGNGRWAKERQKPRSFGHLEGIKRVDEIVRIARETGIEVLTLFTFSSENWERPQREVAMLMRMLVLNLKKKVKELDEANIRFQVIGREEGVPLDVLKSLKKAEKDTERNTGMILNLAFNYGSRQEIIDATKEIAADVKKGKLKLSQIDEQIFSKALYTKKLPDPDLLIRTSGEKRISNFLLWQLSYSELYFTEKYWPDFSEKEFKKAIRDYQKRERRYGRTRPPNKL